MDVNRFRAAKDAVQRAAMNYSVEEALNALAAVAAEAVIAGAEARNRPNLLRIFDTMVRGFVRQAENVRPNGSLIQ